MSNKRYEIDKTWLEEVIISTTERRGLGVIEDPIRVVTKVYSKDGELIAEHDPVKFKQQTNTIPSGEKYKQWDIPMNATIKESQPKTERTYTEKELREAEERIWHIARDQVYLDRNSKNKQYRFLSYQQYKSSLEDYKKQNP